MRQVALDLLALAGLGLFLYGLHLTYPPAALMVGGAFMVFPVIWLSRRGEP